jgi:hypothetical protein
MRHSPFWQKKASKYGARATSIAPSNGNEKYLANQNNRFSVYPPMVKSQSELLDSASEEKDKLE